jgi:hypothetical protein
MANAAAFGAAGAIGQPRCGAATWLARSFTDAAGQQNAPLHSLRFRGDRLAATIT